MRGMRGMRVLFFRERKEPKESIVNDFFWAVRPLFNQIVIVFSLKWKPVGQLRYRRVSFF